MYSILLPLTFFHPLLSSASLCTSFGPACVDRGLDLYSEYPALEHICFWLFIHLWYCVCVYLDKSANCERHIHLSVNWKLSQWGDITKSNILFVLLIQLRLIDLESKENLQAVFAAAGWCVWGWLRLNRCAHVFNNEGSCHPVLQCGSVMWFHSFWTTSFEVYV